MKIDFDQLESAVVEILTAHQTAILKYGVADIAYYRKKSDKTIYAELNPANIITYIETIKKYDDHQKKPGYLPKLGVVDFMLDMMATENLAPLIGMCAFFGMACHSVPKTDSGKKDIVQLLKEFNKECLDGVNETLDAIQDDKISLEEAKKNVKEIMDIINAVSKMKAFYDNIIDQKTKG